MVTVKYLWLPWQIGVDDAIEDLITPLGQLREEVLSLKSSLDVAIGSMNSRLSRRVELREKKVSITFVH